MLWQDYLQIVLLILLIGGMTGIIYAMGLFAGDKDSLANIQRNLAVITGTTSAVLLAIAVFVYIYIRINPQAFVPIMMVMSFMSLEVSLIAVSASVLQKAG